MMLFLFKVLAISGLCFLVSACQVGPQRTPLATGSAVTPIPSKAVAQTNTAIPSPGQAGKTYSLPSPSPRSGPQTLTPTYTPWPTPDTTRFPPTPDVFPSQTPIPVQLRTFIPSNQYAPIPDIYYFTGNTLFKKGDQQAPAMLKVFPDLGKVYDCLLVQGEIVFLDNKALQIFDLSSGKVAVISQFNPELFLYGYLLYDPAGNQLVYWIIVNDPQGDLTRGTILGFYNLSQQSTRELPQFHYELTVLGFDADHHTLYIHGVGDAADFRGIDEMDPQDGHTVGQIEVEGTGDATLSPDKRWLVTGWTTDSPDLTQRWWQLHVYDLSSTKPAFRTLSLPNTPSHITMHFWSEDSQRLYFFLVKGDVGDVGDATGSYGFWSLDVSSGEMSQVAKIEDYSYGGFDLGGPWILLTYSAQNNPPILVNRYTGQHAYLDLPEYPKFVRGR
jgi:hypothetical protein